MKLSYYTTLDGADPLPKLGRLIHTRVEKPPLGPVLAGPTAREGVFSDAKGRLFTNFPENERGWTEKPYFDEKPGKLVTNYFVQALVAQRMALDAEPLSDAAIDAVCAAISGTTTGRMSCSAPTFQELPRKRTA